MRTLACFKVGIFFADCIGGLVAKLHPTLAKPHGLQPARLLCPWVKVAQSCPTLCDPMDYTVHEIHQARILEWVAFPFSRGSSRPRN